MGWSNDEESITNKKGMETSSKILLAIIVCIVVIIIIAGILLINIKQTTFTITIDGLSVTENIDNLLIQRDNENYINIEEFAKLVDYEYHKGEYKAFTVAEDKCYVQGKDETASFYLNDNKVCKLPIDKLDQDYEEFTIDKTIIKENGDMYASIDAINLAFNVIVEQTKNSLTISTLDYIVNLYDTRVKNWGYTGISDQNFENKKSILYGYLIVKKNSNGLYKIIDNNNEVEIVSDRYNSIQFSENTQEFFVTNSLGQVGIINLDGTTKIEPVYDSIEILDKKSNLYLVKKDQKYGVVKSGNITIIYPEYDKIGIDAKSLSITLDSQYLILDTLIPVCKNDKWGAFNKDGDLELKLEYDQFGCDAKSIEINGVKKTVNPVLAIDRCDGVVVRKDNVYGLISIRGKELVPVAVDYIYEIENAEDEDNKYFMYYKDEELNIIERLILAGLIEDDNKNKNEQTNVENNNNVVNTVNTTNTSNNVEANIVANESNTVNR